MGGECKGEGISEGICTPDVRDNSHNGEPAL